MPAGHYSLTRVSKNKADSCVLGPPWGVCVCTEDHEFHYLKHSLPGTVHINSQVHCRELTLTVLE